MSTTGLLEGMAASGTTLYVTDGGGGGELDIFDLRSQLGLNVAGYVGIGTMAPKSALDVTGTISTLSLKASGTVQAAGAGNFGSLVSVGSVNVDAANANTGATVPGLLFGSGSTEAIASKRTPGGNQMGLDFYTGGMARLSVTGSGNVGLGIADPGAALQVIGSVIGGGPSNSIRAGLCRPLPAGTTTRFKPVQAQTRPFWVPARPIRSKPGPVHRFSAPDSAIASRLILFVRFSARALTTSSRQARATLSWVVARAMPSDPAPASRFWGAVRAT